MFLTVILEYINLLKFLLAGYSQLLVEPTLDYAPEIRHSTNLQDFLVYLCNHACQLEYSKQYSVIEITTGSFYFSSLSISTHKASLLEVVTKNNLHMVKCTWVLQ